MTRILHTADWHLGARLVDNDRLPEQALFLDWLLERIAVLKPTLLLVAGDIFDTANPPQQALALYYRFLARLACSATPCRVLILGGNHDSPATLNAPREVLSALSVTVVGEALQDPAEALLEFPDLLVCAVPYLRERDVRSAVAGQSFDEVAAGIRVGVRAYYRRLYEVAATKAQGRPILASGHLTVAGSLGSDSERLIHVGNLGAVGADCFQGFAYVALGHIHKPQAADTAGLVRYPGSPVPLSFSEVGIPKELRIIDADTKGLRHSYEEIPVFRKLVRVRTPTEGIQSLLRSLQSSFDKSLEPWLELTVEDGVEFPDLDRLVREASKGLALRVLKVLVPQPKTAADGSNLQVGEAPSLDTLSPREVFQERLRHAGIEAQSEAWTRLEGTFLELLSSMQDAEGKSS